MICPKCGEQLPGDSEFCQYCGATIEEKKPYLEGEAPPCNDVHETVDSTSDSSTANEIVPRDGAVYVIPSGSTASRKEENPPANAQESTIDAQADNKATAFASKDNGKSKKPAKYCKFCGGEIDPEYRKCMSCGKQYFRPKTTLPVIFLSLFAFLLAGLNVYQYINNQKAESHIAELEQTVTDKSSVITSKDNTISSLKSQIRSLESDLDEYKHKYFDEFVKLFFYEEHAVVVPDDGTKLYHTYGCDYLDTSSFWIYNKEAADGRGYKPCPHCQE